MDDQTRGETPGSGAGLDAPLKRDRKRLRSAEVPSDRRTSPIEPPAAPSNAPSSVTAEQQREPELSPVEELFADQWSPSVPAQTTPEPTIPGESWGTVPAVPAGDLPTMQPFHEGARGDEYEIDQPAEEAHRAKRFLGLGRSRKPHPAAGHAEAVAGDHPPVHPYVPPGGFSGPSHPRLGPLAPMPVPRHSWLAGLDIAALVTAIILPPIGLIAAIVALIKGKQLRGWGSDLARAAISVSLVMTVLFAGVGAYIWASETEKAEQLAALKAEQRAHALVEVASEPFCGVLAAHPTIYSTADPDYGWPAVDAPEGYNAAIANYAAVWAELATVAPEGIAAETAAISERVAGVVNIANALGASNRAGDLLSLHAQTDLATVESWYVEYCDAPEVPADGAETPAE